MHQQRPFQPHPRLDLGQQPVHVVDVLGAFHLRHHDHVELVADLVAQRPDVVEEPRRVEAVHPCPQLGVAPLPRLAHLDQAVAGRFLAVGRHGVFEVAEQHVHRGGDVGHLGAHPLVGRVEEVDHARGPEGDLAQRCGRPERQRGEEVFGTAHQPIDPSICSSISRLHSTAYSIGSVRVTGSMKPFTTMPMACSADSPRLIR